MRKRSRNLWAVTYQKKTKIVCKMSLYISSKIKPSEIDSKMRTWRFLVGTALFLPKNVNSHSQIELQQKVSRNVSTFNRRLNRIRSKIHDSMGYLNRFLFNPFWKEFFSSHMKRKETNSPHNVFIRLSWSKANTTQGHKNLQNVARLIPIASTTAHVTMYTQRNEK